MTQYKLGELFSFGGVIYNDGQVIIRRSTSSGLGSPVYYYYQNQAEDSWEYQFMTYDDLLGFKEFREKFGWEYRI